MYLQHIMRFFVDLSNYGGICFGEGREKENYFFGDEKNKSVKEKAFSFLNQ